MGDSFHGSARLSVDPVAQRDVDRDFGEVSVTNGGISPRPYRGCTASLRRRGVIRTAPTAEVLEVRRGCRLAGGEVPPASEFVELSLESDAYAGVPCWTGGPTNWVHDTVAAAYDRHYRQIRPHMCNGGIAKKTLLAIAEAMASYADWDTGRECRPANGQVTAATGFVERTVQRAHECLRLLGVATEVMRGRQRTHTERMASWRMGDQHRGWASVWALHDCTFREVIHNVSPHLEGSQVSTESPFSRELTTRAGAQSARHSGAARRPAPDEAGRRLAAQWRLHRHAPPWVRKYSTASWAAMLAAPAAAGWTSNDLNALVDDWLGTGHYIPDAPPRPIALLGTLLAWYTAHNTLANRPAALDDARDAQARQDAVDNERTTWQVAVADDEEPRQVTPVGRASLDSAGRAECLEILDKLLGRRSTQRGSWDRAMARKQRDDAQRRRAGEAPQ